MYMHRDMNGITGKKAFYVILTVYVAAAVEVVYWSEYDLFHYCCDS